MEIQVIDNKIVQIPVFEVVKEIDSFSVTSNIAAIKSALSERLERLGSMEISDAVAKTLKSEIVKVRTGIKNGVDAVNGAIKQRKAPFDLAVKEVYEAISVYEEKIDAVLSVKERERIALVQNQIDSIISDLNTGEIVLSEEWLKEIERPKNLFNKTAKIQDINDFIKKEYQRVLDLYKLERDSIEMIEKACSDTPELDVKQYISMLKYDTAVSVLKMIEDQKQHLKSLSIDSDSIKFNKPEEKESFVHEDEISTKKMMWEILYESEEREFLLNHYKEIAARKGVTIKVIKT